MNTTEGSGLDLDTPLRIAAKAELRMPPSAPAFVASRRIPRISSLQGLCDLSMTCGPPVTKCCAKPFNQGDSGTVEAQSR
jgi:hypothetical protein